MDFPSCACSKKGEKLLQPPKGAASRCLRRQRSDQGDRAQRAVLKFGSSVLRDHEDLHRVAGEIYRQLSDFRQIFVVVSAFQGSTDELLARVDAISGTSDCAGLADVVSIGEESVAAQLKVACSRIGIDAMMLRPEEWSIRATGSVTHAEPTRAPPLPKHVPTEGVIIVPGFVALNEHNERVLLGRGGSDFTAIFFAGELGADCLRLYKDVDGVYNHDPLNHPALDRFDEIGWELCREIAGTVIHAGAVGYAMKQQLHLEVGCIGSNAPTLVSTRTSRSCTVMDRPLAVGIAGFGVVGQALYDRLKCENDFQVSAVLVRDVHKERRTYPAFPLTNDLADFQEQPLDIIIDVTSGVDAGLTLSCHQLERGGALISANKAVVEPSFERLLSLCADRNGFFGYAACVGGGTPILELIDRYAESQGIEKVSAVLNGTVNFILDRLALGQSFASAIECARKAGFAEEDPSQDLSGRDAEIKLSLIAKRAFGSSAEIIGRQELTSALADEIHAAGERWIQLATISRHETGINGSISFVPASTIERLPKLQAERNFARVHLADGREFEVRGRGAGGAPTAEALIADMFACKHLRSLAAA